MAGLAAQRTMVEALVRTLARGADGPPRLFETHISWVIVLPDRAYKIKKAVRLPFLDWRDEEERQHCCETEVRLNRRYAPQLYLGVVPVTGTATAPRLGGEGPVIEHAVRLRAFGQEALWSARLAAGSLASADAASLAAVLAAFHARTDVVPRAAPFGTSEHVAARVPADLDEVRSLLPAAGADLDALAAWHRAALPRLLPLFAWRRARHSVRECHGDLHCDNILTLDGVAVPFDGIDFDPGMRWIDTMQDLAFAWMDLQFHGRPGLAARLLSDYLQHTGDYAGLAVLPYYRVQRALVRAKVSALKGDTAQAQRYLAFARARTVPGRPALFATHGLPGSGKSTVCAALAEPLGALVLRSDIERKRLAARAGQAHADYAPHATRSTYARLRCLARHALAAGLPVLVDAACLQRWQRDAFASLAETRRIPFLLLDVEAAAHDLPGRLRRRAATGTDPSDADEAVLAQQRALAQPLAPGECGRALSVSASLPCADGASASHAAGTVRTRGAGDVASR